MPMTAAEKKTKIKEKRASAVKQKLDLLKTRDGSEAPPIESLNENDDFNLTMLFGSSLDENIDWNNPGIDGLMRIYYYITQKLAGTVRDNRITNTDLSSTIDASLQFAVDSIFNGTAYNSGFFIGNDSSDQDTKNRANRGEYNMSSSAFNNNGTGGVTDPEYIITKLSSAISTIGYQSDIGVDRTTTGINNTILGKRLRDVHPDDSWYDSINDIWHYEYGDGVWDNLSQNPLRDFYDPILDDLLNEIIVISNIIIEYITYSKAVNEDYFTNPTVIPGRDNSWQMQNDWINKYDNIIVTINTYLSNKVTANTTELDTLINDLLIELNDLLTYSIDLNNEIESTTFQGNTSDPTTMRGYRFLWVKSIIDVNEGSRVAVGGIAIAIENIEKTITSSEEGFGLFGIEMEPVSWAPTDAWMGGLKTADIVDIIVYSTPDPDPESETFGEMVSNGYVVAWDGAGHSTGYDVYKSLDWDGVSGTFDKILPAGNTYTVEEIDLNNGKVLAYYIDQDVDIYSGEKPYYKVVAYDTGGSGDYARIPSVSEEGEAKNIDDFATVAGVSPFIGPSGAPPSPPGEAPTYLFKWTTIKSGNESTDNPINKTFESEAEFDSIGSNLEVFLNGVQITQGTAPNQYIINGSNSIILNTPITNSDNVTMIVYFSDAGGSESWKSPVNTIVDLPSVGNTNGDIRLVLNEESLYMWNDEYSSWNAIKSSTTIDYSHGQLGDMPDEEGLNQDHDGRYYTQTQVDEIIGRMDSQLDALESLLPEEPLLLGGGFKSSIDLHSGYISSGPFNMDTLEPEDFTLNIIDTTTFYLTNSIDQQFGMADQGILKLYINGIEVDTFNLGVAFNPLELNGMQSYTPAYGPNNILKIIEVGMYNNYSIYQKGVFEIYINNGDLLVGENEVKLLHDIDSLNQYEASMILYYDNATEDVQFNSVFIDESSISSAKFLSGVKYYTMGDKLRFRFYSTNLFKNTYIEDQQLYIQGNDFGCDNVFDNWRSNNVTNNPTASYDDYISYDVHKTIVKDDVITSDDTKLIIAGKDPFNEYIRDDYADKNVLVNTYANKSTDIEEHFVDEDYRIPHNYNFDGILENYTGLWNSFAQLPNGELQVYSGVVTYPNKNYTSGYIPMQSANYGNRIGTRYYTRAFVDIGKPHNNGKLILSGYNINDENNKIYMKLSGQTGWLDLSKPYNEADFFGRDDDGCLISSNGEEFNWTSGTYSTANSGYMIILRVEMKNASVNPINFIKMVW